MTPAVSKRSYEKKSSLEAILLKNSITSGVDIIQPAFSMDVTADIGF